MNAGVVSLLWVLVGVVLLVAMIVKFKINSIIALILSAIFIALADGISVGDLVTTMEDGLGGTLKSLALIIIFGAAIGKLMTDSGASQQIADTIVDKLGIKLLPVALLIIGVIFGMSMFYEVAFLIVTPLVISIAKEADIPYMRLIIPAVSGTTMGHSLFPPQPGPMALVSAFGAEVPPVYIFGLIVTIPTLICSGLLLCHFIPGLDDMPLGNVMKPAERRPADELPQFWLSILVPLFPAIIMIGASIIKNTVGEGCFAYDLASCIGSADITMLITMILAMVAYGYTRGMDGGEISSSMSDAIKGVANVLLVIGAGGIMKQVIITSGVGATLADMVSLMPVSPLILAWVITVVLRLLTGQGTVSAITAAGVVAPMVTQFGINPVLAVLVCACASNTITPMYDGGYLLFQQSFGLSMKDTYKTWGLLELVNSVVGLIMVLILSLFI